jgi:hypothetical protein
MAVLINRHPHYQGGSSLRANKGKDGQDPRNTRKMSEAILQEKYGKHGGTGTISKEKCNNPKQPSQGKASNPAARRRSRVNSIGVRGNPG